MTSGRDCGTIMMLIYPNLLIYGKEDESAIRKREKGVETDRPNEILFWCSPPASCASPHRIDRSDPTGSSTSIECATSSPTSPKERSPEKKRGDMGPSPVSAHGA